MEVALTESDTQQDNGEKRDSKSKPNNMDTFNDGPEHDKENMGEAVKEESSVNNMKEDDDKENNVNGNGEDNEQNSWKHKNNEKQCICRHANNRNKEENNNAEQCKEENNIHREEHDNQSQQNNVDSVTRLLGQHRILKAWHAYVADLMCSEHISDAALYDSCHGTQLATSSPEFLLRDGEYKALINGFRYHSALERSGVWINGDNYKIHLNDGHFGLMGKRCFPRPAGCSVCKTRKLLIIAAHKPGMRPEVCNEAVMNMGDFFRRKDM